MIININRGDVEVSNVPKFVASMFLGVGLGTAILGHFMIKDIKKKAELADKQSSVAQMLNQWLEVKQKQKSISDYLYAQGYHEIAIYGMNFLGERLLSELKDTEVTVRYVIDKNTKNISPDIKSFTPDESLEKVDAIIVSVNYYFDEICKDLSNKVDYPVVNLEDILYDL